MSIGGRIGRRQQSSCEHYDQPVQRTV